MTNEEKDKSLENGEKILDEKDAERVSGGGKMMRPRKYGGPDFFRKRKELEKLRGNLIRKESNNEKTLGEYDIEKLQETEK